MPTEVATVSIQKARIYSYHRFLLSSSTRSRFYHGRSSGQAVVKVGVPSLPPYIFIARRVEGSEAEKGNRKRRVIWTTNESCLDSSLVELSTARKSETALRENRASPRFQ